MSIPARNNRIYKNRSFVTLSGVIGLVRERSDYQVEDKKIRVVEDIIISAIAIFIFKLFLWLKNSNKWCIGKEKIRKSQLSQVTEPNIVGN